MGHKGLILAAALALAGCQTPGGSFCRVMVDESGNVILRPTHADVAAISDQLARGLTIVLETTERECAVKP